MFVEVQDRIDKRHYLLNTGLIAFLDMKYKNIAVHYLSGRIELTDEDFDKLMKILTEETNNA